MSHGRQAGHVFPLPASFHSSTILNAEHPTQDNTDSLEQCGDKGESFLFFFILITLKKHEDDEPANVAIVDEAETGGSVCFQGSLPETVSNHSLLA